MKTIALIGYSGHSYVVYDCFFSQGQIVSAYTETAEKKNNPFSLKYLGDENNSTTAEDLKSYEYFVAVGDNLLRKKITDALYKKLGHPVIALHKSSVMSRSIQCGEGVMIGPRVIVNAFAEIGNGVILNSGCIVEHECKIGNFAHIAPGAVLLGNVSIGEGSFIGANSVVRPGIKIGSNTIVGAGSVVVKDIPANVTFVGNPARKLEPKK